MPTERRLQILGHTKEFLVSRHCAHLFWIAHQEKTNLYFAKFDIFFYQILRFISMIGKFCPVAYEKKLNSWYIQGKLKNKIEIARVDDF